MTGISRKITPLELVLRCVCTLIMALSAYFAFVGLGVSSLWVDELFTAHFSDPAVDDWTEILYRSVADVNPPLYHLILWYFLRLTGFDFVEGSRGLSAIFSIVAMFVVMLAPTKRVDWTARLFAGAFASTSWIWFEYTQQARSYAWCFILVTVMLAAYLRILERFKTGQSVRGLFILLSCTSVVAAVSHYYTVFVSAALFGTLLLACRTKRAFSYVFVSGLSALIPILTFVAWHRSRMVVDVQQTWFPGELDPIVEQLRQGLDIVLGFPTNQLAISLLLLLFFYSAMVALETSVRNQAPRLWKGPGMLTTASIIFVIVISISISVAVSYFVVPMISYRIFVIIAPIWWVGVSYIVFAMLQHSTTEVSHRIKVIVLMISILMPYPVFGLRGLDEKQPWRQTAVVVSKLDGCMEAQLPVIWFEQAYYIADDPEHFYGFYLPENTARSWLPLNSARLEEEVNRHDFTKLVQETVAGQRKCKLVLWGVHLIPENLDSVVELLNERVRRGRFVLEILTPQHNSSQGVLVKYVAEE